MNTMPEQTVGLEEHISDGKTFNNNGGSKPQPLLHSLCNPEPASGQFEMPSAADIFSISLGEIELVRRTCADYVAVRAKRFLESPDGQQLCRIIAAIARQGGTPN
jgi:hypothetical protein